MLANALVLALVVVLAGGAILESGAAMARVATHLAAERYTQAGYERGLSALESSVANDIARGADPRTGPFAQPSAPAPQCAVPGAPCSIELRESLAITTLAPVAASPAPAASCDPAAPNCAEDLDENGGVREGRVSGAIAISVTGADGSTLLARVRTVTLRTFAVAPYAAITGTRDGSIDDAARATSEGDDGGIAPPTGPASACATPVPTASGAPNAADTLIRIAYVNAASNACTDGTQMESGPWQNGNAQSPQWSP